MKQVKKRINWLIIVLSVLLLFGSTISAFAASIQEEQKASSIIQDESKSTVSEESSLENLVEQSSNGPIPPSDKENSASQTLESQPVSELTFPTPFGSPQNLPIAVLNGLDLLIDGAPANSTSPIVISKNTLVEMNYTWKINESVETTTINAEDYSILGQINGNFPIGDLSKIVIPTDTGTTYTKPDGTPYKIGAISFVKNTTNKNWDIVVTYDAEIQGLSGVTGNFKLNCNIIYDMVSVPDETVSIKVDDSLTFTFNFPNKAVTNVKKSLKNIYLNGALVTNASNHLFDSLEWEVDVNTVLKKDISGLIVDTIPVTTGIHFFESTADVVKVEELLVDQNNGEITVGSTLTQASSPTVTLKQYSVTMANDKTMEINLGASINSAYRITLRSHVDYKTVFAKNDNKTLFYTNNVSFNGIETSKTFATQTPSITGKSSTTSTIIKNVEVAGNIYYYAEWCIYINRPLLNLGKNVAFVDTLLNTSGHKLPNNVDFNNNILINGSTIPAYELYTLNYDAAQNLTSRGTAITSSDLGDYLTLNRNSDSEFQFTFKDLNQKGYYFYCRTLITDEEYTKTTGVMNKLSSSPAFTNPMYAGPIYLPGAVHPSYTTSKKAEDFTGFTIDPAAQTMGWQISAAAQNAAFTNFEIEDNFNPPAGCSMTLLEDSFEVYSYTGNDPTIGKLSTSDYVLRTTATGFSLKIPNSSLKGLDGKIYVSYKTNYTLNDTAFGTSAGGDYKNEAKLTFDLNGSPTTNISVAQRTLPGIAAMNAAKKGVLAADKESISWRLDLNINEHNLGDVQLEDVFSPGMKFDGNITQFNVYKVTKNGNASPTYSQLDSSEYSILPGQGPVGSTKGFSVGLHDVRNWYVIEYNTKLTPPLQFNYTNTATFTSGGKALAVSDTVLSDSNPSKNILDKSAIQNGENYEWTVNINKKASNSKYLTIQQGVFTDTLSAGLILDKSSIEVFNVSTTNVLTPMPTNDYTIHTLDGDGRDPIHFTTTFRIEFLLPINQEICIKYNSIFDPNTAIRDPNTTQAVLSNAARLTGTGVDSWVKVDKSRYFNAGSGSGSGSSIPLRIEKRDSSTGNLIDGAVFEISKTDGTVLLDEITTTNGIASFPILGGTYTIRECTPPSGYSLSATNTKQIVVNSSVATANGGVISVVFYNDPIPILPPSSYTIVVHKKDSIDGRMLEGAVFNILNEQNDTVGSIHTGADGKGAFRNLPAGSYSLLETKAPDGYALPSSAVATGIVLGANVVESTVTLTITNVKNTVPPPSKPSDSSTIPPISPSEPPAPSTAPPDSSTEPPASAAILPVSSAAPRASSAISPVASSRPPISVSSSSEAILGASSENSPVLPENTPAKTIEGAIIPDSASSNTSILGLGGIPLGGFGEGLAWSLLNLLMSLISILSAVVLLITIFKRKWEKESQNNLTYVRKRSTVWRLLSIITGFVPGILFLLYENIRLPVTWITQWTPIIGAFFIINMSILLIFLVFTKKDCKNDKNIYRGDDIMQSLDS